LRCNFTIGTTQDASLVSAAYQDGIQNEEDVNAEGAEVFAEDAEERYVPPRSSATSFAPSAFEVDPARTLEAAQRVF
jgi:hypothetical protein